jgi:hypothetical protein
MWLILNDGFGSGSGLFWRALMGWMNKGYTEHVQGSCLVILTLRS